jgi:hypothetical protein
MTGTAQEVLVKPLAGETVENNQTLSLRCSPIGLHYNRTRQNWRSTSPTIGRSPHISVAA